MVSRSLYPFASHYLAIEGLRYHYVEEGVGDPVVCVHGNPTWSFYFRDVVRDLSRDHRVVAMDHIGCGLSDKPSDTRYDYRLRRRVEDLERLVDHLDLGNRITLVLHDWGGMIGMAWASRHPERVSRLVILNTAAFRLPARKRLPWQLWLVRKTPLGAILVRGLNAFSRGLVHTCSVRMLPREVRNAYLEPHRSWNDRRSVLRFVEDIPLEPTDPSYATVMEAEQALPLFREVPMLVCWGMRDFVFDADFLREWQSRFPDAEILPLPDAGHLVLEDAGERIVPTIRDFLRRHPVRNDPGGKCCPPHATVSREARPTPP